MFLLFCKDLFFYSSVSTLYRTNYGITLSQMGMIDACLSVCIVLFEVPWGYICDKIGYKKTLLISNGIYFLSKIVFWKANGFCSFLLERVLLAFALAGLSGCDNALIYLSLDKKESAGVFGKVSMFGTFGMCVASIVFTLFFSANFKAAALATAIAYFAAFLITFFLIDIREEEKQKASIREYLSVIHLVIHMLPLLLASVLLTETTHILTTFYNQLQYTRVGIPVSMYGILYLVIQFVSLSTGLLDNILLYIRKEKLGIVLFCVALCSVIGLVFATTWFISVLWIAVLMCVETMYFSILNAMENEAIENTHRATTLSIFSLVTNLCTCFTDVAFGYAVQHSLLCAYGLACVFVICGLLVFIKWIKLS